MGSLMHRARVTEDFLRTGVQIQLAKYTEERARVDKLTDAVIQIATRRDTTT